MLFFLVLLPGAIDGGASLLVVPSVVVLPGGAPWCPRSHICRRSPRWAHARLLSAADSLA